MVTTGEPVVHFWPAGVEPPQRIPFAHSEEANALAASGSLDVPAGGVPRPIITSTVDSDGGRHAYVTWPERGADRALDELVAAASVPVDYEIDSLEPTTIDLAVEAALVAAAAESARRERKALIEERLQAAEATFAQIEQEAVGRSRARRQSRPRGVPDPVLRYFAARVAAARIRHAARAARR